mmetsp:Transcript_35067/g.48813  ORF Transcript_35067/g.48813 Transcript_35067/m.48813 type:complete len:145 (+) Transcript_35067:78-512(+)
MRRRPFSKSVRFDNENKRTIDASVVSTPSISEESSVSSTGPSSTSSSPGATAISTSTNSILRVRREDKMREDKMREDYEKDERAEFEAAWRRIIWTKFKNPINFLFSGQGEFVSFYKDGSSVEYPHGSSSWMLSWHFLSNIGHI